MLSWTWKGKPDSSGSPQHSAPIGASQRGENPAASHLTLRNSPYGQFPDNPAAYRDNKEATLEALFRGAVAHAESRIRGYDKKAEERSRIAKAIRFWSLLFFAAGTLAPIAVTLLVKLAELLGRGQAPRDQWIWFDYFFRMPLAEIGYVLLALAGALIIFDQFFDTSGSWIRFRQAQARLEVLLAEFRFTWAQRMAQSSAAGNGTAMAQTIGLVREFVTKVEMLAEDETKEWAQRFSQRINAYDRNPSLRVSLEQSDQSDSAHATQSRNESAHGIQTGTQNARGLQARRKNGALNGAVVGVEAQALSGGDQTAK
jgi:hypothetical protein